MSFHAEPLQKKANYYAIKFNDETNELYFALPDVNGEKLRRYVNPKTKQPGETRERAFGFLIGTIKNVTYVEKLLDDKLTTLRNFNVSLGEDENGVENIISFPIKNRFTDSFLKALPNIDLEKEVRIMPYDFIPKEGPRKAGVSVAQRDEEGNFTVKVQDFFTKKEEKDGQTVYTHLHGLPEATEEDKEDWTLFYQKQSQFLNNWIRKNYLPRFQENTSKDSLDKAFDEAFPTKTEYPKDEIDVDSIPF